MVVEGGGVSRAMERGQGATMECRGSYAGEISIGLTGVGRVKR